MLKTLAMGAGLAALLSTPALAGQAGDLLRQHLYSGTIPAGLEALSPLAASGDEEAKFGLGVLTFFSAVEGMAQEFYRYGLVAPNAGRLGPTLTLPVPTNSNPEPIDYGKFRAILVATVDRMDQARGLLLEAGESGDYVVMLDAAQFRVDMNGDGVGDASESVAGILATNFGEPGATTETTRPPKNKKRRGDDETPEGTTPTTLGFDRADAIWLAGYTEIFAGTADYLLAHDFSALFDVSFHRLFPHANLPMQEFSSGGSLMFDPESDTAIADLIAAVAALDWPVVEPDRLRRVLNRMRAVTQLSRENWRAILAETDDNREWLPAPRQTSMVPEAKVTDEMVAAWHATLDTADRITAGELLLPHWRFKQGFDLKAYLETAKRTDLVMIITGYGALPFLKDGPIVERNSFAEGNRVFGDMFPLYLIWFN